MTKQYNLGINIQVNVDQQLIKQNIDKIQKQFNQNNIVLSNIKFDNQVIQNLKSKLEATKITFNNLAIDLSKLKVKNIDLTLNVSRSELDKVKQLIQGINPVVSVKVQGQSNAKNQLIPGGVSRQEIDNLVNSLRPLGTVLDYTFDKFGKLKIVLKDSKQELQTFTYQWDQTTKKFQDANKTIKVPDLLQQTDKLKNQIPQIKSIYDQFKLIQQQALGQPIDFQTQKLIPGLELLNTKMKTMGNGIQQLTQVYKLNEKQTLSIAANYNMLKGTIDNVTTSTGNLINRQIGLGEAFKIAMERFPIWMAASTVFFQTVRKIGEAFSFTLEQTKLFTNLQMEMTNTNLVFGEITEQANEFALSMGATSDEVMKAISVFGTYNSTLDEVLEKTQAAVILSNITGNSMGQSADELMATIAQFRLNADDALHVVDMISSVARNLQVDFPKAVAEVSLGMRTVGAVAKESGVSIEELSATLGTLVEATRRSGSQVANGLKTIYSRLSRVSEGTNPEEFTKVETALYNVGVAMKSTADTMRPASEILEDLASKWSTLTDVQKNSIAQETAGVYQRNIFLSLMENYDKVIQNTTSALNSEGVAMQKQEIFMKSLTASLNELKSTWQQLFLQSANIGIWKTFIEGATASLSLFNKFADIVGTLPAVFMTVIGVISLFSTKLRVGLLSNLGLILAIRNQSKTLGVGFMASFPILEKIKGSFTSLTLQIVAYRVATIAARLATAALQATMTLGLSVAFTLVIGKVMELVDNFIHAKEKAKEAFEEIKKSVISLNSELTEAQNLINIYKELSDKTLQTAEDKQKLADIEERLASLYPDTTTGLNTEGKQISDNIGLVERYIKLKEEELRLKRQELSDKFYTQSNQQFEELQTNQEKYNKLLDERKKKIEDYTTLLGLSKNINLESDLDKIKSDISDLDKELSELLPSINQTRSDLIVMANAFDETSESGEKLGSKIISELIFALDNSKTKTKDLFTVLNNIKNSQFVSHLTEANKKIKDITDGMDKSTDVTKLYHTAFDTLVKDLVDVGWNAKDAKKYVDSIFNLPAISLIDKVIKPEEDKREIKDIADSFEFLNSTLKELNESHILSSKTIADLSEKYPELIQYLGDEAKLNDEIKKKVNEETKSYKSALQDKILNSEGFLNTVLTGNEQLRDKLKSLYGEDFKNFQDLNSLKTEQNALLIEALGQQWSEYYKSEAEAIGAVINKPFTMIAGADIINPANPEETQFDYGKSKTQSDKMLAIQEAFKKAAEKAKAIAGKIILGTGDKSGKDKTTGGSKSTPSISDILKDELKYETEITKAENLSKNLTAEETDLKLKNLEIEKQKQNDLLWYYNYILKNNKEVLKDTKLQDELKSKIAKTEGDIASISKEIKDINNDIVESQTKQKEKLKEIADQQTKFIKDFIDFYRKQLLDSYDDEISKLEDKNDLLKQEQDRNEKLLSIQKQKNKLNEISKEKNVRLFQNGQWTWVADPKAMREAQDELLSLENDYKNWEVEVERQAEVDKLKKEKDNVDKQLDNFNDLFDGLKDPVDKFKAILKELAENASPRMKAVLLQVAASFDGLDKKLKMVANSMEWHVATPERKRELEAENQRLGREIGANYDPVTGRWDNISYSNGQVSGVTPTPITTPTTTTPQSGGSQFVDSVPAGYTGDWRAIVSSHPGASDTVQYELYDQGGEAKGIGYMPKDTIKPERVLSPEQTKSFNSMVAMLPNINRTFEGILGKIGLPKFDSTNKSITNNRNVTITNMTVVANNANEFMQSLNRQMANQVAVST